MKTLLLKRLALVCLLTGAVFSSHAQFGYYNEALRFSRNQSFGTARIMGLGGAQVALGGDIGVVAVNPAGLGFFNRSTLTISPAFDFHNSNSEFFGTETTTFRNRFLVPEI